MSVLSRFRSARNPRFSTRLRDERMSRGISSENLARKLYISEHTLTLIENGEYEPSVVLASQIARELDTTVEALFTVHPPTAPRNSSEEERIQHDLSRRGSGVSMILSLIMLALSNILINFTPYEEAGIAIGILWVAFALWGFWSLYATKGLLRYSKTLPPVIGQSQRARALAALLTGALFYIVNRVSGVETSTRSGILSAVLFTMFMYFADAHRIFGLRRTK